MLLQLTVIFECLPSDINVFMQNHQKYDSESQTLLQVTEVYNFNQDDLMTEDIFILDCHSDIYVWVGQQVDSKNKLNALSIGEVRFNLILCFNCAYKLLKVDYAIVFCEDFFVFCFVLKLSTCFKSNNLMWLLEKSKL